MEQRLVEEKEQKEDSSNSVQKEQSSGLLDDSPLAFIEPHSSPKRERKRRTTLEAAIDAVNELKAKGETEPDSVEYRTRRATLEKTIEAVNEAAQKAARQASERIHIAATADIKRSSITVKKIEPPPPSTPSPVRMLKQQKSVTLYDAKINLSREQKWELFLQLPMKSTLPNGNIAHDMTGLRRGQWQSAVYMTIRQFKFDSSVPGHVNPRVCLIINPDSKLTHACFSIMDMGKCCDEQYPKILEMMYETFIEFDIHKETRYRPSIIMVDDPLLAVCLRRELEGYDDSVGQINTTVIKLVYDDADLIPTTASSEDLSLSRLCRSNFAFIRQVTVLFQREHGHKTEWGKKCHISKETMSAVLSGTENRVDLDQESDDILHAAMSPSAFTSNVLSSPSSSAHIPLVLKACVCCGILYPHVRRCSGCSSRIQTNYCSSECSHRHWKTHKEQCDEQVWSYISLI